MNAERQLGDHGVGRSAARSIKLEKASLNMSSSGFVRAVELRRWVGIPTNATKKKRGVGIGEGMPASRVAVTVVVCSSAYRDGVAVCVS